MTGPHQVNRQTDYQILPTLFLRQSKGDTVIDVQSLTVIEFLNIAPITVTNFIKAIPNQTISILGDGFTTIADNSFITTNSGSNVLLANGQVYQFIFIADVWYQLAGNFSGLPLTDGDKGDITVSGLGTTWTIDNDVVTFAKMQNISTDRLLGRESAASGDIEELSLSAQFLLNALTLSIVSINPSIVVPGTFTGDYNFVGDIFIGTTPPIIAADGQLFATQDVSSAIQLTGYGGTSGIRALQAGGSLAAPTAINIANNLYIGYLGASGYDGTVWNTTSKGIFGIKPADTWTNISHPTRLTLETTSIGSVTRAVRWSVEEGGHLLAGVDNTYDIGASGATRPRDGWFGRNIDIAGTLTVAGLASLNGNVDLGNASTDLISINGEIDTNVIPDATNTYDLGSTANRWKDGWFAGDVYGEGLSIVATTAPHVSSIIRSSVLFDIAVTGDGSAGDNMAGVILNPHFDAAANFDWGIGIWIRNTVLDANGFTDTFAAAIYIEPTSGAAENYSLYSAGINYNQYLFVGGDTTRAGLRITSVVAPSSPNDGDLWGDGTQLRYREAGANQYASWTEQAAVADATGAGDVVAQLNSLLAKLRTINIIAP